MFNFLSSLAAVLLFLGSTSQAEAADSLVSDFKPCTQLVSLPADTVFKLCSEDIEVDLLTLEDVSFGALETSFNISLSESFISDQETSDLNKFYTNLGEDELVSNNLIGVIKFVVSDIVSAYLTELTGETLAYDYLSNGQDFIEVTFAQNKNDAKENSLIFLKFTTNQGVSYLVLSGGLVPLYTY